MATNKNAVLRYNTLDKCFSNFGRQYFFDDLLEKVNETLLEFNPESTGIKTRQLREDIKFMKSEAGYSAPIEVYNDSIKPYYRYEEKGFSINNSPLNETEAQYLKSAISVLQRFEGVPQFEWINEIGPMLSSQFVLNNSQKVISYDTNIDYSGYDKIVPIFNAIVNKRVLTVEYEPFNKESSKISFHPHFLKQFNNRWFTFGLNEKLNIPKWNMALDRIKGITESSTNYIESGIDWEEHFYDIIGVTMPDDGELADVELIFTKEQSSYVFTKPLHPSQKAKFLDTGELEVKLKLIPNHELEMVLLSFGEKVKVIKPEGLRLKIKLRVENAAKQY